MRALFWVIGAACVAFAVAFIAPLFFEIPVLFYFPLERRFTFEARPEGLAMSFYGRTLFGIVAGACAGAAAFLTTRR